jgi:class 3 adenylate cyclase
LVFDKEELVLALADELRSQVRDIFRSTWTTRTGQKVPDTPDVSLGNDAVEIDGTVLYADLVDSTQLVDEESRSFAAEVYKAYLLCASRIIKAEGGEITAFDGDRVMAVFIGDSKNTAAARCALKINYGVKEIVNPGIQAQYPQNGYRVRQVVGVDTSELFVARTGIRGSNDLVWVGRAANYAAKLCTLRTEGYASYISGTVFDRMGDEAKYCSSNGRLMWEQRSWTSMKSMTIYRSSWSWQV